MAADGSQGPRPFKQRQLKTLFVRVPVPDWPLVRRGLKREFRGQIGRQTALFNTETPTPVVAWSFVRGTHDARLMILEAVWQEELGAISDESLAAEGFDSFEAFRRYWLSRERSGKKFRPTKKVFAYRIRPWEEADRAVLADLIFTRLYGEFHDAAA